VVRSAWASLEGAQHRGRVEKNWCKLVLLIKFYSKEPNWANYELYVAADRIGHHGGFFERRVKRARERDAPATHSLFLDTRESATALGRPLPARRGAGVQ